jgi:hypothetical protein
VSRRPVTSASRASWRSPGRFTVQHGHLTSGRILVRVTMAPLILWGSCNNTRPVFGWPVATGASWPVGS